MYHERLKTLWQEVQHQGAAHPLMKGGDPALLQRLAEVPLLESAYVPPTVRVTEERLPDRGIRVRIYQPLESAGRQPMLVWCHGGAWVGGDLDMPEADATAREVCVRANAVVVSVDYRLAINSIHYPLPHRDVVEAYVWAVGNAERLGVDRTRATLGGASAGANLAAGAALRIRSEALAPLAGLALAYPLLHAPLPRSSDELAGKTAKLTPLMAFASPIQEMMVENYLGAATASADCYAMPGMAGAQLSILPQTWIENCEYDSLRASGEMFAAQLRDANVVVRCRTAPDVAHGHLNRPGLPQSGRSHAALSRWVHDCRT